MSLRKLNHDFFFQPIMKIIDSLGRVLVPEIQP